MSIAHRLDTTAHLKLYYLVPPKDETMQQRRQRLVTLIDSQLAEVRAQLLADAVQQLARQGLELRSKT